MQTFIIYRHNHAGWFRTTEKATTVEEAKLSAIYTSVPWLKDYSHTITFKSDPERYVVEYTGKPREVAMGRVQYPGFWWADEIRAGEVDDCLACGGTGVDHYCPFKKCWKCDGEKKENTRERRQRKVRETR